MGNKKAFFAVSTTTLTAIGTIVACGSDHAKPDAQVVIHDSPVDTKLIDAPPDAPAFDFSCMGNSAPAAGSAFTVSGTANVVGFSGSITFGPLGSAAVTLCKGNCTGGQNNLGSATTNGSGDYSIGPTATNGSAVDAYVRVTHAGDRTILAFPASPFTGDTLQPVITFQSTLIDIGGSQFGCPQTAGNGMVGLLVTDCANKPINDGANIQISVQQGGSDVGDAPIDAGGISSMASGFFLVCDVPPGTTTVKAKYMTKDLRSHDVNVTAGTTTETIIRPGF